jgi:hypothetical protein
MQSVPLSDAADRIPVIRGHTCIENRTHRRKEGDAGRKRAHACARVHECTSACTLALNLVSPPSSTHLTLSHPHTHLSPSFPALLSLSETICKCRHLVLREAKAVTKAASEEEGGRERRGRWRIEEEARRRKGKTTGKTFLCARRGTRTSRANRTAAVRRLAASR